MKEYVYNHCPAIAALGKLSMTFSSSIEFVCFSCLGPVEQLRDYNRTRSRMYTIAH